MEVRRLGCLPYVEARRVQEDLVEERRVGKIEDTLLLLEHPPTLSLGLRAKRNDAAFEAERWKALGVEVVHANRGGDATYHAPGQLILYPIFSLKARGWGVREFVEKGLSGIAEGISRSGVPCQALLEPVGVWIKNSPRKLASVGLRIHHGVTNHGFSVNISCDLKHFSYFPVCGAVSTEATSVFRELGFAENTSSGESIEFRLEAADLKKAEKDEIWEEVVSSFLQSFGADF